MGINTLLISCGLLKNSLIKQSQGSKSFYQRSMVKKIHHLCKLFVQSRCRKILHKRTTQKQILQTWSFIQACRGCRIRPFRFRKNGQNSITSQILAVFPEKKPEGAAFFLCTFFFKKKASLPQKYDSGVFLRKSHSHSVLTV